MCVSPVSRNRLQGRRQSSFELQYAGTNGLIGQMRKIRRHRTHKLRAEKLRAKDAPAASSRRSFLRHPLAWILAAATVLLAVWMWNSQSYTPEDSHMDQVYWTLGMKQYASYDTFVQAVEDHCDSCDPDGHKWDPDAYVCDGPVSVEYELVWKGPPDDFIYFPITDEKKPVTQGELLFHLNNNSYEYFRTDDHRQFEGLGAPINGRMYLVTGSWPPSFPTGELE